MDTAPHFDRVTYISATPIERKYYLEELKRLPEYGSNDLMQSPSISVSHKVDKPARLYGREYAETGLQAAENAIITFSLTAWRI